MNSKREKFYLLCRKIWTAGSAAALATAFFISGNQFTPVAHAQWGGPNPVIQSPDDITISGRNELNLESVIINSDKSVSINNSTISAGYGGVIGGNAVTISDSDVTLTYTGILESVGTGLTINGGSNVTLGNDSRVTGAGSTNVNGATLTQGTGGVIEAKLGDVTLGGGVRVTQGDNGSINTRLINGGAITISGGIVTQGDDSDIEAKKAVTISNATVTQGDNSVVTSQTETITISSGGSLIQGDNADISTSVAGKNIVLNGGEIEQGLKGIISSAGAIDLTGGKITQLSGNIYSGNGYGITVSGTTVDQGNSSRLVSGGILTLNNGASITQGAVGQIAGGVNSAVNINGATITQGDDGEITSQAAMNITGNSVIIQGDASKISSVGALTVEGGSRITQEDSGEILGNSIVLNGATIEQAKDGRVSSDTTMTITGGTITQESGLSVITSIGDLTVNGATINQSVNTAGNSINSRLGSGGTLTINGGTIRQGEGGRISGDNGVILNDSSVVIAQGDYSKIETLTGKGITLNGNITQGNTSEIATTGGGKLDIKAGTQITQGTNSSIVNSDNETLTLDGTVIRQGGYSQLRTGGDLVIKNTGARINNVIQGNNSLLAAGPTGSVTLDNAGVSLGARSQIRVGGVNIQGATEAARNQEKEAAAVGLRVINGSLLNFGPDSSIVSEVNGSDSPLAFSKIHVGAGSEIHTTGIFTFNNDWVGIDATGRVTSTDGIIRMTNESKLYGNGNIVSSGLIVTDGSILAPGGNFGKEIGTLHISGPLTVTQSGIVEIHTDANGNCDLIDVADNGTESGDVIIGGSTLRMYLGSDDIRAQTEYSVIRAEGEIAGEFANSQIFAADGSEAQFKFFDANTWVDKTSSPDYEYLKVGLQRNTYFTDHGITFNQKAAGRMLDSTDISGDWWDALTHIGNLGDADFLRALDMVSGGVKANSLTMYRETPVRSAMDQFGWNPCGQVILGNQNRFCANQCQKKAVWATPYHSETDYRSDGNAGEYSTRSTGFLAGINRQLDQTTVFGVFFGYGRPELSQGYDEVEMDDLIIGLQAGTMITSKLELKAMVTGGFQSYSMRRYMDPKLMGAFGSPILTSDYDGNTVFASIELARPIYLNTGVVLRPVVAFESENVWQDGFSEQGDSIYALEFEKVHNDRTFVRTGISGEFGAGNFNLLGRVFYSHQLGGTAFSQGAARFNDGGNAFQRVRGVDLERNFLTFGAGGNFYLNPRKTQTVSANYDATMSEKSTSHLIYASFTQMF